MNDSSADGSVHGAGPDDDRAGWAGRVMAQGIEDRPSLLLAHLGSALEAGGDNWLAPSGLSGRDYAVLAILTTDQPDTQQELALLLGKAPGVAVIAVDRLEAAGLVERHRDPADRRRSRVVVTPAGREALGKADDLSDDGLSRLLPGLTLAQRRSLHQLLTLGIARPGHDSPTS